MQTSLHGSKGVASTREQMRDSLHKCHSGVQSLHPDGSPLGPGSQTASASRTSLCSPCSPSSFTSIQEHRRGNEKTQKFTPNPTFQKDHCQTLTHVIPGDFLDIALVHFQDGIRLANTVLQPTRFTYQREIIACAHTRL
jgi:hypothetical protein